MDNKELKELEERVWRLENECNMFKVFFWSVSGVLLSLAPAVLYLLLVPR